MPESIIVKDNTLFNQFRNTFPIFQNQIEICILEEYECINNDWEISLEILEEIFKS